MDAIGSYQVYLAVNYKIYEKFFAQVAIELIIQKYQVFLLVIDIQKEEIIKWISWLIIKILSNKF